MQLDPTIPWHERRDLDPEGVASGDPESDSFETEFVCIPRPIERSERVDGGPLLCRTRHRASLWRKGEKPGLELQILEGDPRFSV